MNIAITPNKKCLILFSSPNKAGYTKQLLEKTIASLPNNIEYETIDIYKTDIKPCIDCKACFKGACPFNDDGMREILNKIWQADIIIAATPVYFNAVPSKFKAIFDRTQQLFVQKVILHTPVFTQDKVGILLTTAGSIDSFATQSINAMFKMFFSTINAKFIEHIAITNSDNLKSICIDEVQISNIIKSIN
ncbi:MAG: flavodoxin family protein [Oscillospiraceae bacterium]